MRILMPMHGGPDDGLRIDWDFSSNANAVPLPAALYEKLTDADRRAYPEPRYTALRERLSQARDVSAERIVPTAGSSEAIRRLTLAAHLQGVRRVWVPRPGYADYAAAASALGMAVSAYEDPMLVKGQGLMWLCEPCNPTGRSRPVAFWSALMTHARAQPGLVVAIDRAYEPLRLSGTDPIANDVADACWQLWSPNKALGLTGVRAGWMQAPALIGDEAPAWLKTALQLAPSWVMSAEGVHLLVHWDDADVQAWLVAARNELSAWMQAMQHELGLLGWACEPSTVPFFLATPARHEAGNAQDMLGFLRGHGIKLRDAQGMGLPGQVRLRAHTPPARQALLQALAAWPDAPASKRRTA
ncbi:MAG: aminotransferase class I/II-fold pyridoxal phosphate-dependent enzyme [Aquabacterium sp.]